MSCPSDKAPPVSDNNGTSEGMCGRPARREATADRKWNCEAKVADGAAEKIGAGVVENTSEGEDSRLLVPCTLSATSLSSNSGGSWLEGSDSCPSISPSPGPDGGESFLFSDIPSYRGATEELSAALQAEKEFLDFMCSLPQVQAQTQAVAQEIEPQHRPPAKEEVSSLDHLGHLCRVVEQLAELKEQNVRLQRRVQYLEDLRLLHQMHQQMKQTLQSSPVEGQYEDEERNRTASQESLRQVGEFSGIRRTNKLLEFSGIRRTNKLLEFSAIRRTNKLLEFSAIRRTNKLLEFSAIRRTNKLLEFSAIRRTNKLLEFSATFSVIPTSSLEFSAMSSGVPTGY